MNDNTAITIVIVAICATVASCFWTSPARTPSPQADALTVCIQSCITNVCVKNCADALRPKQ